MNEVLFVLFATIEALSFFIFSLSIYRFDWRHYKLHVITASILMAFLSFALWSEDSMSSLAPIVSLLFFTIFTFYILRVSIPGAVLVSGTGYVFMIVNQAIFLGVLSAFGVMSIDGVQENGIDYFMLSIISSLVSISLGISVYKKGYGFTFPFKRLRDWWTKSSKWENLFVLLVLSALILLTILVPLLVHDLYIVQVVSLVILSFLLFHAIRKEKA